MKNLRKSLHWGPFPWEHNGGAVVQLYLLNKMRYLMPKHEFHGIPKTARLLVPEEMPYMLWYSNEMIPKSVFIPDIMYKENIPLLVAFHISKDIEPVIEPVHDIGGKILMHQTVHFTTDMLFDCKCLNDVDWFVAPTLWSKSVLTTIGGVSHEKITVIPHGVDTKKYYPHKTAFRENNNLEDKTVILFTGRLSLWKGATAVIPLIRDFTKKYNCAFVIRTQVLPIPDSQRLDYVMTRIACRNKNVIYIPDWQPPSIMEEIFASCDILLSPTGSEGFNVPLIEAMACGMVVITTSLPNHNEILGRHTGLFVKPKKFVGMADEYTKLKVPTTDDLYKALKYIVENTEEAELMGEMGRKRAVKFFDLTKITKRWIKLMNTLTPVDYDMENEMMKRLNI